MREAAWLQQNARLLTLATHKLIAARYPPCVTIHFPWHNSTDVTSSSSCRATINDFHAVFIALIYKSRYKWQWQGYLAATTSIDIYAQHITVPRWMPIARAMSAKFKAFSLPAIIFIVSFFCVFQYPMANRYCDNAFYPLTHHQHGYK